MKSTTIYDVANKTGVSIDIVSRVLNDNGSVDEGTRQKVLSASRELDYRLYPGDRRSSLDKMDTIGVIIPSFDRAFHMDRLSGIISVIGPSDYHLNVYTVETISQRHKIFQTIAHNDQIDGLLVFYLTPTDNDLRYIRRQHIPTVLVDAVHPDLTHLVIDDVAVAHNAVDHLVTLGHHKIAYLSGYLDDPLISYSSQRRYEGYCQALEAANIPFRPEYHCQGWLNRHQARQMTLDLMRLSDPPTAIFTFNDELALGVLETARDLNLRVPDDLSVVGCDDTEPAQFVQLTTVRQNLSESGVQSVELLLSLIESPDTPPTQYQRPAELIVRQTTAPPA